jgi:hypothetical protein
MNPNFDAQRFEAVQYSNPPELNRLRPNRSSSNERFNVSTALAHILLFKIAGWHGPPREGVLGLFNPLRTHDDRR